MVPGHLGRRIRKALLAPGTMKKQMATFNFDAKNLTKGNDNRAPGPASARTG
jgi:hypothetical protein